MAKHSLNEQTEQPQYDQISKRVTFTHEPNTAGLSEQARGNLALQQAQAVVGSSVCDSFSIPSSDYQAGIGIWCLGHTVQAMGTG